MGRSTKQRPFRERFWEKVKPAGSDECWEWIGGLNKGYGEACLSRSDVAPGGRRKEQAHRVAYGLLVADIPDGLELDHLCRNRACVNPWHLDPVPTRVNLLRGVGASATNARKTHCKRGHEFTDENTYLKRIRSGELGRECRICMRLMAGKRRQRRIQERNGRKADS